MCWSVFGASARPAYGKTHRKKDIDEGVKLGEYELLHVVMLNGAGWIYTSSSGAKFVVETL